MQDLGKAIAWLREAPQEIHPVQEPRLFAIARYNLLSCLDEKGEHGQALKLLPEVQDLFHETAHPLDRVRLRWTEGSIAFGLGRLDEAEAAYRDVQQEFLKHGVLYSMALVSLDLALLLSRQGRTEELKRLAAELMAIFSARRSTERPRPPSSSFNAPAKRRGSRPSWSAGLRRSCGGKDRRRSGSGAPQATSGAQNRVSTDLKSLRARQTAFLRARDDFERARLESGAPDETSTPIN